MQGSFIFKREVDKDVNYCRILSKQRRVKYKYGHLTEKLHLTAVKVDWSQMISRMIFNVPFSPRLARRVLVRSLIYLAPPVHFEAQMRVPILSLPESSGNSFPNRDRQFSSIEHLQMECKLLVLLLFL